VWSQEVECKTLWEREQRHGRDWIRQKHTNSNLEQRIPVRGVVFACFHRIHHIVLCIIISVSILHLVCVVFRGSGFCPETPWRVCMCRQAVRWFVHGFWFWLIEPPGRDEYPPGGVTVFAFSVELRLVQGHWDF